MDNTRTIGPENFRDLQTMMQITARGDMVISTVHLLSKTTAIVEPTRTVSMRALAGQAFAR